MVTEVSSVKIRFGMVAEICSAKTDLTTGLLRTEARCKRAKWSMRRKQIDTSESKCCGESASRELEQQKNELEELTTGFSVFPPRLFMRLFSYMSSKLPSSSKSSDSLSDVPAKY